MDEYEDLDVYNDDTIHNMWVDLDNIAHTGATRVCGEQGFGLAASAPC